MSVLVPTRRHDPEWLDREGNAPEDVAAALRDIAWVNRRLGGRRSLLAALDPYIRDSEEAPLEVLDVGAGGGDLAREMVAHARRRGKRLRVVALDRDPTAARVAAEAADGAREPGAIAVVRGDAFALPFRERSFDLVTASLFLHHFRHEDIVRLLRGFLRVARGAVLVNDLRRHRLPWALIAIAARATRRHPMFVHDAPLSVLRSFTAGELLAAARESGGGEPRVERAPGFRLVLTLPATAGPR